MWVPSPELLAAASPANAFLACRWNEFFDRETPDSYQPRIFHLPFLVQELADVAEAVKEQPYLRKHLSHIKQECRGRILGDTDFFRICSAEELLILEHIAAEATDVSAVAERGKQLLSDAFFSTYEERALDLGKKALVDLLSNTPPRYGAADRWLALWATIALHRKYNISDAYVRRDQAMLIRSLHENVEHIAAGIAKKATKFVCVVSVLGKRSPSDADVSFDQQIGTIVQLKDVANAAGVGIARRTVLPDHERRPDELLLITHEIGVGRTDALEQAVRRLRPMLNLLGFYRGAAPAAPINRGWVGPTERDLMLVEMAPHEADEARPRKNATRLTKLAVRVQKEGRLRGIITNALELHNMALSSPDLRVRYLTMWSALECLASESDDESVISRVMNLVVPVITWRRLEKQIRYLGRDLLRWRHACGAADEQLASLPNAASHEVPSEDVLMAVTRPANHPDIVDLLNLADKHALLKWRIFTIWQVFHDPKVLRNDLSASSERLTWHLGRIYRMRNRLAHAGDDSVLLEPLLNNLEFYLSTTISRLLHVVTLQEKHDAATAAAYWAELSSKVMKSLADAPATLTVADLLPNPRLRTDKHPWGGHERQ